MGLWGNDLGLEVLLDEIMFPDSESKLLHRKPRIM